MRFVRRALVAVATVALVLVAGLGLWQAGHDRPQTLEQRTEAIAAELSCPTCQAQSVAMSRSEIAAAMRAEIHAQLASGRTPEQVRAWFADRYGRAVLLEPPREGVGLMLWLVPAALLGVGLVLIVVVVRRKTTARPVDASPGSESQGLRISVPARLVVPAAVLILVAAGVITALIARPDGPSDGTPATANIASSTDVARSEQTVADRPTNPDAWTALGIALENERAYGRSAEAYHRAAELRPQDVRIKVRLGLVLLQAGEPLQAESVAQQILSIDPAQPEGLLVLGFAERARGLPQSRATLQRFLSLAPDHPAADEVRRLIPRS